MASVGATLHESAQPAHPPAVPKWVNVVGWIFTVLPSLLFLGSGGAKLLAPDKGAEMMNHLGLSPALLMPLGLFEVACVLLYLAPATSMLAAILLTGYLGGAILAHVRVGDPYIPQMLFGVLLWLGIFFRDYRVRQLLPLRRGLPRS